MSPGADHPRITLLPPLYPLAGLALGLSLDPWLPAARPARPAGWVLLLAALSLFAWAVGTLRRAKTTASVWRPAARLVAAGPFARSRNPVYLAMLLALAAAGLLARSSGTLLSLPWVLVLLDRKVVRREEEYLERRFGGEYRRYKRSVRRWL